jgi:hypothetical protein
VGLVNKLASENHFNLDLIAEGLSAFARRWLVVDFAGPQSRGVYEGRDSRAASHSLDEFVRALRKRFGAVKVLSMAGEGRVLLVCEK